MTREPGKAGAGRMRMAVGVVGALAALVAITVASAVAATPTQLSDTGQDANDPQVAIGADGARHIVWERSDGSFDRIEHVRVSATGAVSGVDLLSDTDQNAEAPQVAVAADGVTDVVWCRSDGTELRVEHVRIAADGTVGTPQQLSPDTFNAYEPQVAVAPDGTTTVVWRLNDGANMVIQLVRIADDGTVGSVATISPALQDSQGQQLAVAPDGTTAVVWRSYDGANFRARHVRVSAAGTVGTVDTLSDAGQDASNPYVAIAPDHTTDVTWDRSDGANTRVEHVRVSAAGAAGTVQLLSAAGTNANARGVAAGPTNTAVVAWQRWDATDTYKQAEFARISASGSAGTPTTVTGAATSVTSVHVALSPIGTVDLAWTAHDGSDYRIDHVRVTKGGVSSGVSHLSAAGNDATAPQIAYSTSGNASVVWSGSDGVSWRAVLATLPDCPAGTTAAVSCVLRSGGGYTMTGTAARETISGSGSVDVIRGGAGADTISGKGGNDTISGGAAADTLHGGDGNDTVTGGDGNDWLWGDAGNDTLHGNGHVDRIYGVGGADRIWGDAGNDILHGNSGNDRMHGGLGADYLYGDGGSDSLWGDAGDDHLFGGLGIDLTLDGGSGIDVVFP